MYYCPGMAYSFIPVYGQAARAAVRLLLLFAAVGNVTYAQFAALSVDVGSQFFKVGLVKPGIPMQIALNGESGRKSPSIVGINNDEMVFSTAAEALRRRSPQSCYAFLVDLLGKKLDNPVVHEYRRRFPFAQLVSSLNRGTVVFKTAEGEEGYGPEQLMGMILFEARSIAAEFAGQNVTDAVISVPGFFNQAERRAMITAAEIAGLNVLNLINDHTAAGLNYGMFRRNEITDKPIRILIYDLGASKATASVFQYTMVEDRKTKDKYPQMDVLGIGFDRFLGGLEFSLRLRKLLADKFMTVHKTKVPIVDDHRSMMKLLYAAEKVKIVLSGISDTTAAVESLHESIDFKAPVSRTEFENACTDLYDRVAAPLEQALLMANLSLKQLDHVILMGGASRMPKFQQILGSLIDGHSLGHQLNADEAIAMGAIYHAAPMVKSFKVKKFVVKEANLYPVEVHFESKESEGTATPVILRRTLYDLKNTYPQKKMITFTNHTRDFEFVLNYGDLSFLNEHQSAAFGSRNITRVDLLKIEQALTNHSEEETVFKGIRAHFEMDRSGIVHLLEAESIFHKPPPPPSEPSTLSKIGSTISNFFSGSDDKNDTVAADSNATTSNATASNDTEKTANDTTVQQKVKMTVVKVPLDFEKSAMDVPFVNAEWVNHSVQRLMDFNEAKRRRELKERNRNELETFLFELTDNLSQENMAVLLTDPEMEALRAELKTIGDWLDEQDVTTTAEEYQAKLMQAANATTSLAVRFEHREKWPVAVKTVRSALNYSVTFLEKSNSTVEEKVLTEVEVKRLLDMVNETETILFDMETTHNNTALNEDPRVNPAELYSLSQSLEREVRYLLNKVQIHQQRLAKEKRLEEAAAAANQTIQVDDTHDPSNVTLEGSQETANTTANNDTHAEL